MRVLLGLAFLLGAVASTAGAAPALADDRVSDIVIIPIHDGANVIPRFAADGRAATIFRAWRDNGNAHGHDVYLVTLPLNDADGPQNTIGVVTLDDAYGYSPPAADVIGVSPFDGERVLSTIRFARAKLDGTEATVLIRADLAEPKNGVMADHALLDVSIYRLQHPGVEVGTTPDAFKLFRRTRLVGRYCNADMGLHVTMGLPLPTDYAGGPAPSGCIN
jgi:hypothetical protein